MKRRSKDISISEPLITSPKPSAATFLSALLHVSLEIQSRPPLISKKPAGLDPHFLQAIKEDKKRGVLSEGEYRRSYRKTSQLNDMRFGGGLSADAR